MDEHGLARPAALRQLWRGYLAVLVMIVAADFFVTAEPHFGIETIVAFNAWYGFLACAALILVAKGLGAFLTRPDDYYGQHDD